MKKGLKTFVVIFAMLSMLVQQQHVHAQAAPVANFVVNRAVAGVVTRVAVARGFAANDPRIAATLAGIGQVSTSVNVASTVAGVAMSIAGAPVWLTVAAGLGIMAVGYGIYAYTSSGKSVNLGISNGVLQANTPLPMHAPYVKPVLDAATIAADPSLQLAVAGYGVYRGAACSSTQPCNFLPPYPASGLNFSSANNSPVIFAEDTLTRWSALQTALANLNCTSNCVNKRYFWGVDGISGGARLFQQWTVNGVSTTYITDETIVLPAARPVYGKSLNDVAGYLPEEFRQAKIDEITLANVVDQAWKTAAAQSGYTGLPYSVTDPITDADVQPWIDDNPSLVPSISDLLTPASNAGSQTVVIGVNVTPSTDTGTNPNPGVATDVNVINTPTVNVGNVVKVDFGGDPGTASPALEATPSASEILGPLVNLMPELRAFKAPGHVGSCPKPSIEALGKTFVMDTHCTIAEENRSQLAAVMAAVWMLVSLRIVLSA